VHLFIRLERQIYPDFMNRVLSNTDTASCVSLPLSLLSLSLSPLSLCLSPLSLSVSLLSLSLSLLSLSLSLLSLSVSLPPLSLSVSPLSLSLSLTLSVNYYLCVFPLCCLGRVFFILNNLIFFFKTLYFKESV